MAYPEGMQLVSVTVGSSLDFFGNHQPVKVSVAPVLGGSAVRLIWEATGQPVVVTSREFTGEAGVAATFTVPNPDQGGFIDGAGNEVRNWSYTATITCGNQRWVQPFQPLAGQASVDLDLVHDGQIAAPSSAPAPLVTSVNGKTGAVVISTGGGEGGTVLWDDVLDKPDAFPSTIALVQGLQDALDAVSEGADGRSAYEVAVANGYEGTELEWLADMHGADGADGADGKSAYEIWLDAENEGTEQDFLDSLKGEKGDPSDGSETVSWGNVTDKPETFPPATHNHAIVGVTGLQDALDGKQAAGDYATTAELTSGLASKQDSGDYVEDDDARLSDAREPLAHDHTIDDVEGLAGALSDKVDDSDSRLSDARTPTTHSHPIGQVDGLQDILDTISGGGGVVSWDGVTDKPATYPPSGHGHEIGDVTGLQDALDEAGEAPAWGDVTGKPATFPPAAHSHAWDTVTAKPTAFPPAAHDHQIADVDGLSDALESKVTAYTGEGTARVYRVNYSGITDTTPYGYAAEPWSIPAREAGGEITAGTPVNPGHLTTKAYVDDALGALQPAGDYIEDDDPRLTDARTPTAHGHAWADITDTPDLDALPYRADDWVPAWADVTGKPATYIPTTHDHPMSEVTGLEDALDGKQDAGDYVADDDSRLSDARTPLTHSHGMGEVTGLSTALAGKSDTGHGHTISSVSGLQGALDSKQPVGSYATTTELAIGLSEKADKTDLVVRGVVDSEEDLEGLPAGIYFVRE